MRRGAILSLNARERFWWGVMDKIESELTKSSLGALAAASTRGSEAKQVTFKTIRSHLDIRISASLLPECDL